MFRPDKKTVLPPVRRDIEQIFLCQSGRDLVKVIVDNKSYLLSEAELRNYLRGMKSQKVGLWVDYLWNFKVAVFDVVNDLMSYPKKDIRLWLKNFGTLSDSSFRPI